MAMPPSGDEIPTVVLPKAMVATPITARDRPQVASMVSIMRPYRWRTSRCSTSTPNAPTASGASTSMEIQMGTPH